jgi:hypothetical protein
VTEPAPRRPLHEAHIVQLPKISDVRGNLTFVESQRNTPFRVLRVYWLYDVPGGDDRGGGHAYKQNQEFIVALSGSVTVTVGDGSSTRDFTLNRSYFGLYVPNTLWRSVHDFSTNSVCLVFASQPYDFDDYIRDQAWFRRWRAEEQG